MIRPPPRATRTVTRFPYTTGVRSGGYDTAFNDVMAGESIGRIIYRGKTGMIGGHISFDLHVIESGTPLVFDNVRRKVDIKSLPQEVRSEERRVGKECVSKCRSRCAPHH